MAKKGKNAAKQGGDPAANIKLGTRVRHVADGVEGRIVWANAAAVKIQWHDGEKVTWKRGELAAKGLEILAEDEGAEAQPAEAPTEEPRTAGGLPLRPVFRNDGRRVLVTVPPRDEEGADAREPQERAERPATEPQAAPAAAEPAPGVTPEPTPADVPQEPTAATAEATATPEATGDQPETAAQAASEAPAPPVATEPEAAPAKPAKKRAKRATPAEPKAAKLSALDAAAKVLAEHGQPMSCRELIGAMAVKGYRTSPGGKTPAATLYAAVTMLPKWAPLGAGIKRARSDPVGDSDLLGLDLDAFHQASDDLAPGFPVGVFESGPDLLGEIVQVPEDQA